MFWRLAPRALVAAVVLASLAAGCLGDARVALDEGTTGAGAGGFSQTSVFPGDYDAEGMPRPVEAGPFQPRVAQIHEIASAVDGATIRIGLVRPETRDHVPVIVVASPYFAPMVATPEEDGEFSETVDEELRRLDDWFVPHGYAVAAVAVRGSAGSGGCMEYMGLREQADLDQAVTWLGTQEWSNGNVGMIGLSYEGSTPWMVAARGNPHLKTIVPMSGVNDVFDLHFRNGTPQERGLWHPAYYWVSSGLQSSLLAGSAEAVADNAACAAPAQATAAAVQALLTGARSAYFDERSFRRGVEESYRGSVFLVQGLQDWNVVPGHQYPWINHLEDRGVVVKHLLGQWAHTTPEAAGAHARVDFPEILLRWWDYWLKNGTSRDLGPRVQVEDDQGRWRDEDAWPPRDSVAKRLYLTSGGLAREPSRAEEAVLVAASPLHLVPEPGPEARSLHDACAACVVARSDEMPADVAVSGFVRVRADATPLGAGAYVTAFLYVEEERGARRLGWGSVDLRFAHGGADPQPVTPGKRMPLTIELEPLDGVVPAGARLVLVLAQGSYGPDRPTAWELPAPAMQPLQVHVGGEDAWLELPTIERPPEAYFEPPARP